MGTLYGSISACSYSAPNTTVTVTLDSGSLTSNLSAVSLGVDPSNDPIPYEALKGGPSLSGTNTWSGTNNFSGTVNFSGKVSFLDDGELTIASGAITITGMNHTIDTEGDASTDDLVTINGGADGVLITLRTENDARDVVLKHGSGNIKTPDGVDITLSDDQNTVTLLYDAALTAWLVQSVFRAATSTATDTAAGIVEKATIAEMIAETSDKYPDAALLKNHPGVSKAWGSYKNLTSFSTYDTYNVTSIADTGVGIATVTIANDMASANYTVLVAGDRNDAGAEGGHLSPRTRAAGSFVIRSYGSGAAANTLTDWDYISFDVKGTLA